MVTSINTNPSAFIALQNLQETNRNLETTQNRVSTGLKVSGAKDNASTYAIAQNMRGSHAALSVVSSSLDRAVSIANIAIAAGEIISDLLIELREKATAAMDASIGQEARDAYQADFASLIDQVQSIINDAEFDGANMLNNSLATGISFIADATATDSLLLPSEDFTFGGLIITLASDATLQEIEEELDPATGAVITPGVSAIDNSKDALDKVMESLSNVNTALARLGAAASKIENHAIFVSKLQDQLSSGIGNLVDADLAKESAALQALQVKQQLGIQSLSIANQAPQAILSLFQ